MPSRVELHLHLEGALAPREAVSLGRRAGVPASEVRALYRHADFGEFLRHFGSLVSLLREPADLVSLLGTTLARLARQGVLYAEVRVSPSVWERHGMDPEEGMSALSKARIEHAPEYRLIVDAVRQWGVAGVERDLTLALKHRKAGCVALGLGGDEAAAPADRFRGIAEACVSEGIGFVPHAGEGLGPEEVERAASLPGVRRLGHGVAAVQDPATCLALRDAGVHLEICPGSNYATGVVPEEVPHPVGALFRAGVSLSLSTDDPALFATSLPAEERHARRAGLRARDIVACRIAAARAAFLPAQARQALARRLEG